MDSNPELDEAFGPATAAPSAATSLDSELDAAFGPPPARAPAATSSNPYDPNRPAIGDELENELHSLGSGLYHNVAGGFKGLYSLATTRDPDKAADVVNAETAKIYSPPVTHTPSTMSPGVRKAWEQGTRLPAPTELGDIAERAGASPGWSTVAAALPSAAAASLGAPRGGLGEVPKLTATGAPEAAQAVVNKASEAQSMGAAGKPLDISEVSPEGQAAVAKVAPNKLDTATLQNHVEAEKHGVDLTRGQASRDVNEFSHEQNTTNPDVVARINKQEGQLVDAIDNVRREASPTTVGNDYVENGRSAVDSLKAYDEPIQADIRAKYKALTDANGGSVPIDTGQFLGNVDAALKKGFLTKTAAASPEISEILDSVRSGEPMDFEAFENARTRLAAAQRGGGSAGEAARLVRGELEQIPLSAAAAPLKGLADTARSAARARFEASEADPAYQAVIDDVSAGNKRGSPSPLADTFLDKYVLSKSAPKSQVDLMMSKLDDEGKAAVTSHTLNAIRKGAVSSTNKVRPQGYSDALAKYQPKIDSLVSPETKQGLEEVGRVINNAKVAPPGNYVNYSKSGVIMNAAQGLGETALNAKTMGLGVPVIKGMMERRWAEQALQKFAGIEKP